MPIQNVLNNVNLTGVTNYYLNHPANAGMSEGYWFYYSSSLANNTLGTQKIKPYRWGTALDTNQTGDFLTIEGTIQLVSESLNRTRVYHGSTITRNGEGINVQTGTQEDDSFYFYHLGDLRANDEIGYWDYALTKNDTNVWEYFQYHQHQPSVYEAYYGGRNSFGYDKSIEPSNKRFIYLHNTRVSSMGTQYSSVLARVHTPSVGGAHNSHFDVELPSVITKNYIPGGTISGTSNRFHCFYLTANGAQWDVFSRTFVLASNTFTAEVNHGTFDLADPTNQPATRPTGIQDKYPLRVSAGDKVNNDIYIPVIYNNVTGSTFDLNIWKFESNNQLTTNPLSVQTIATGYTQRPDCHLVYDGNKLTALVSDVQNGGVDFFILSGSTWVNEGNLVTNGAQDIIRIHGYNYNNEDARFYTLISGDVTGSVGSYSGSGIYSFSDGQAFTGYTHVSYITGSYGFRISPPTLGGFISYQNANGSFIYKTGSEPQGILESENILIFGEASPEFYDKVEFSLGGSEYIYDGLSLRDGRQVFVGNLENNPENRGEHDFLVALYTNDYTQADFFATGGEGDDYFDSVVYDTTNNRLWLTGYSKSYNVPKRDMFIHGFGRGYVSGSQKLEWKDMVLDSEGNQYFAGYNSNTSSSIVSKMNYNFEPIFVNNLFVGSETDSNADIAYGITLDSENNIYVAGSTQALSSQDSFVVKLDNSGSIVWSKYFGTNANEYASSIALVQKNSVDYLVTTIPSGSSTIINVLNTSGSIIEQNVVTGFTVNRVRKSETETNGFFLLAGKDNASPSKAKIAKGQVLSSGDMIRWVRTYSSGSLQSEAFDIRNTEQATGVGGLGSLTGPRYHVVGNEGTNGFIMKFIMDESAGSFFSTKVWGTNISGSVLTSLTNDSHTLIPSGSRNTYVAGYSNVSPEGEGGFEGIIGSFDYVGNRRWLNTLGHTDDERLVAIENDITGRNIITAGWSESHSNGRRTFNFRSDKSGFGTGNYHLLDFPGMAMWYQSSSLSTAVNNASIVSQTTPLNVPITLTATSGSFGQITPNYEMEYYDGGNIYDMIICKIDVNDFAIYKNQLGGDPCKNSVNYVDDLFTFYQFGAAGDGLADDGNFFGYDVLIMTGSNDILVIGQTSGDFGKHNIGLTGVYDYILTKFNPITHYFEFYQNGTILDEEVFNGTEINDGSGSIAFVGRTLGNLGGSIIGGYDIFLGLYNPISDNFDYYQTGSGQIDRAMGVHDIGNNTLAVIYETADVIGTGSRFGGIDVGIIKFNYNTRSWDSTTYQVGSTSDERFVQESSPSIYLPETERIAIVGKTLGNFSDDGIAYGSNDIFLALFDTTTNTFKKYQVGSESNETPTHIFSIGGDRLVIGGFADTSFSEPNNGIIVTFDSTLGIKGKRN